MVGMTLRRLRGSEAVRQLTRQIRPHPEQFIQPHFVVEGLTRREPAPGLAGVYRETPDSLLEQLEVDARRGVDKILLFGVPREKRERDFQGEFVAQQLDSIKRAFGDDIWCAVDVCLCSATTHGHCGVLDAQGERVDNRGTVAELAGLALAFAESGADCVAPSDMMDGRVGTIRQRLDQAGYEHTVLMSYASKFKSSFYGPFREAAESAPRATNGPLSDRASYQLDPARPDDALMSARRDADEGADILMVKPGLPYLDILSRLSSELSLPLAVYETSGEFAAMGLLAETGLADQAAARREIWTAFVRAGASMIISYGARDAVAWLQ
jgi:porphobilinogen synthase